MAPWPAIKRGTDCTVPSVPGFVSDTVAPTKSSAPKLALWTLRTRSSYASRNVRKSMVSASRMTGTRRLRVPSARCTSTARPSPTCSWRRIPGVPFLSTASTKEALSEGISARPFTIAYAMKCVKETLAPLERDSDSLSPARLISRSRADTLRTLVAVGTARLASIFVTMRAAAPRRGVASASISVTRKDGRWRWRARDGGHRGALVVGEELAPTLGDRVGVREELVVHIVDEPGVRSKGPFVRLGRRGLGRRCHPSSLGVAHLVSGGSTAVK